jgi:hypothetical protein
MSDALNFNDAGDQRSFDVIPDNTICVLQMTVNPGGAGQDHWLTKAKDGNSEHVACEFVITEGEYAKRKLWARYTVASPDQTKHGEAIDISRRTLRAILESALGYRPDDKSEAAEAARRANSYGDFDQLRFLARLGIEPPKNGYAAKNVIKEVITPERQTWRKVEQIDRDLLGRAANTSTPPASSQASGAQPPTTANKLERPNWA